MGIKHLTDNELEQELLQSENLVLVDFWAPWCGSCQVIGSILEELAQEYNARLKICKINIDDNKAMATKYQILSIPTLLFFKDGKIVGQLAGARTAADIKKEVEAALH